MKRKRLELKKLMAFSLCTPLLFLLVGCEKKSVEITIENVRETEKGIFCNYSGEEHRVNLYLPEEEGGEKTPLVVMLHGYGGDGDSFRSMTGFDEVACKKGYAVLYVTVTTDKNNPAYAGWNAGLGGCEKDDVGFLKSLVKYVTETYDCDSDRVYAVGFSNGAFMTQRLAVEASDAFSGIVSVAGGMAQSVWKTRKSVSKVSVLEIYGTKDDVVPMEENGSAKSSVHPSVEKVMEYWVKAGKSEKRREVILSEKAILTEFEGENGTPKVWKVRIEEGRHSWPSENFAGFSVNELIMDFFEELK